MKYKLTIFLILLLAVTNLINAAVNDITIRNIRYYLTQAQTFSKKFPHEKVFVHLDNTSYFAGDKIWFQCYVINSLDNTPTSLSNTLYVELLNPRGKVIGKQILKIRNGRCSGAFTLNHLPFYSGFYEIRAYTKYMLNFGETAIFSRIVPVFEHPEKAGDYSDQKMTRDISKYTGSRPAPAKSPKLSMRFFPEGGKLIAGVPTRVAFEITGRHGRPIEGKGIVIDEATGHIIDSISTIHEGRGYFTITPEPNKIYTAVIQTPADNTERKFRLPESSSKGIGLCVDNITNPDSIYISVTPAADSTGSDMIGLAVTSRGILLSYSFVNLSSLRTIRLNTKDIPSGVSLITLFGADGRTLADRMIFINNGGVGQLNTRLNNQFPAPHEKVTLEIEATDPEGNPEQFMPMSVSVSDADNAVDYQNGLLADLLLQSEIKGYVHNPIQYFTDTTATNRLNLDLLMMISGWRNYSWEEIAGINPLTIKYYPEQTIELDGKVVSFVRGVPKANTDISVLISQHEQSDSAKQTFTDLIATDSCGNFTICYDLIGKWDMVTSVSEKGKSKNHRLILNRLFSPTPRRYEPQEMVVEHHISSVGKKYSFQEFEDSIKEDTEALEIIEHLDNEQSVKTTQLDEVVVSAKRNEKYLSRSKSIEYYDMQEELGNLADEGIVISNDIFDILKAINPNFTRIFTHQGEKLKYKTKGTFFVINYKTTHDSDSLNYTYLYPESIKSIYITEDPATMLRYADPITNDMFNIDAKYGCAVLIETFDEPKGPAGRGTRLQTIEGYTVPPEYRNIDSLDLLDEPDIRRTLYWNPDLTTDADGKARLEFINNSTSTDLRISIQAISPTGILYSD
ncbi:MAG: hypothetical protein HDS59_00920 [Barnesiella sp.]|nr:hypothetical protein [Barnesiella sp.]